jgi:hypothetical protein
MTEAKGGALLSWLIAAVSLLVGGAALYLLFGAGVIAFTPHLLAVAIVWGVIWGAASKLKKQQP